MINLRFLLVLVALSLAHAQITTVAIVATNDIHGTALPTNLLRSDTQQNYTYGGLEYMATLIQTIKNQYPGHTLYLDAGDQFQGGIQSSPLISSGKIMTDYFDAVQTDGSAVGNHQFDFGPQLLFPYMRSRESVSLAANLRSETGKQEFLPQQKNSKMYEFKSGIRIGVIGISTTQTPSTTSAFADGKFPKYKFQEYKDIVIEESAKLRKAGANAVLVNAHIGNGCKIGNKYGRWKQDTVQPPCGDDKDEVTTLINQLPQGTIDGFIQGHRHVFAHHFIKGVPYMGTINGGYYFNVLYLQFDRTRKIIHKEIQGPIPVCEKVFANYGTCEYLDKQKIKNAGPLVPYRFHNKQVHSHPRVKAIYQQQWLPKMKEFLVPLATSEVLLAPSRDPQTELGNLITSLMHTAVPSADFVLINSGGLRTIWLPGFIQYQHFYNMFPFTNYLVSFDITGDQLLKTLQIVQAGDKGFYPIYGIKQTVSVKTGHKFISATWMDGTPIQTDQVYRGVSIDFLLKGGDDFKNVIGKVFTPKLTYNHGTIRDLIKGPLMQLGNIKEGSLIDPQNPRVIIVE